MKKQTKVMLLLLVMVLMAVMATGCSKAKKGIKVKKSKEVKAKEIKQNFALEADNHFTVLYEEEFGEDYYDKNELESMIDSEIKEFNENSGSSSAALSKAEFKVESGWAKLTLRFAGWQDYVNYARDYVDSSRNARFFIGTLEEAKAAGYKLDGSFSDLSGNPVQDPESLLNSENTYVLFTNQGFNMSIGGEVLAFNKPVRYDAHSGLLVTADKHENLIIYKK